MRDGLRRSTAATACRGDGPVGRAAARGAGAVGPRPAADARPRRRRVADAAPRAAASSTAAAAPAAAPLAALAGRRRARARAGRRRRPAAGRCSPATCSRRSSAPPALYVQPPAPRARLAAAAGAPTSSWPAAMVAPPTRRSPAAFAHVALARPAVHARRCSAAPRRGGARGLAPRPVGPAEASSPAASRAERARPRRGHARALAGARAAQGRFDDGLAQELLGQSGPSCAPAGGAGRGAARAHEAGLLVADGGRRLSSRTTAEQGRRHQHRYLQAMAQHGFRHQTSSGPA